MKNEMALKTVYWASVSGGKDSLYMLKVILENPNRYPLHGIVHFELEIDFPFIKDVIAEMKRMVEPLHIPFLTYKPRKTFAELYDRYGFPTRQARWCNKYKLDCAVQHKDYLLTRGEKIVYYIGFCADEVKRFKDDDNIYPLADMGIVESTILEWAKDTPIFNDYYKYNTRCGCYMCPMASIANDKYLYQFYPELFWQKMRMAKKTENERSEQLGRAFSVWRGNPKYDTTYRVMRILELVEAENEKIN